MLPVCICADGYEHSYNKKHCVAKGEDADLLVAVDNDIRPLNPYVSHKMGTPGQESLFDNNLSTFKIDSMDVYYNEGHPVLYMSLKNNGSIASIKVGSSSEDVGRTFESIEVIVASAGEPGALAIDWVNKNLYWADLGTRAISLINLDTRLQRTVVQSYLSRPHDIAVDPDSGQLFIADTGLNPKILAAWLDGSHVRPLVQSRLRWPSAVSLDYPARRLYWADLKRRTVETVRLDGRDRKLVAELEPKLGKPHRLDIFEDSIYLTTFKLNKILKLNKFGRGNVSQLSSEGVMVTDLVIMQLHKHDDLYTAYPCQV